MTNDSDVIYIPKWKPKRRKMSEEKKFPPRVGICFFENGEVDCYTDRYGIAPALDYISEEEHNALLAAKDAKLKEAEAALEDVPCICEYFFEASNKEQLAHQCDRCAVLAKLRGEP